MVKPCVLHLHSVLHHFSVLHKGYFAGLQNSGRGFGIFECDNLVAVAVAVSTPHPLRGRCQGKRGGRRARIAADAGQGWAAGGREGRRSTTFLITDRLRLHLTIRQRLAGRSTILCVVPKHKEHAQSPANTQIREQIKEQLRRKPRPAASYAGSTMPETETETGCSDFNKRCAFACLCGKVWTKRHKVWRMRE